MNIYLGPYLRCTPRTETVTKTVPSCPNTACGDYGYGVRAAFCSLCGSKIIPVNRETKQDSPDTFAVSESIHEALTSLNQSCFSGADAPGHLWLVNAKRPGQPRKFGVDGCTAFDVSSSWMVRECQWFNETFDKEIKVLDEAYNGEAYVEWGLIVSDD